MRKDTNNNGDYTGHHCPQQSIFKDIAGGLETLPGDNITTYTGPCDTTRKDACGLMISTRTTDWCKCCHQHAL